MEKNSLIENKCVDSFDLLCKVSFSGYTHSQAHVLHLQQTVLNELLTTKSSNIICITLKNNIKLQFSYGMTFL